MVIHDLENRLFKIEHPEGVSCLEYSLENGCFTVLHTKVPPELSGKGLAAALAAEAFHWATGEGFQIRSECSYMTAWMKRHVHVS